MIHGTQELATASGDDNQAPQSAAVSRPPGWRLLDRIQLAALMGVHPDTVTDYARQGMPVLTRGGRGKTSAYDAVDCLEWWRNQQGKNLKEAAQTRLYVANAANAELKLQVQRGELWPRAQIIYEGQKYTRAWAAKVRGLARQLVQRGVIPPDKETSASAVCLELLREIAGWKSVAEVTKATKGPNGA